MVFVSTVETYFLSADTNQSRASSLRRTYHVALTAWTRTPSGIRLLRNLFYEFKAFVIIEDGGSDHGFYIILGVLYPAALIGTRDSFYT